MKNTGSCKMKSFKCEFNGGLTPFHGVHMHDTIYAANILNVIVWKDKHILMLIWPIWCFFLPLFMTSYFVFPIFFVNYASYRYSSLGIFLRTQNQKSSCADIERYLGCTLYKCLILFEFDKNILEHGVKKPLLN